MIFDDGSSIDETTGIGTASPVGMLPGDMFDAQQMQPFSPGANQGAPWYQNIIAYGMTRAIDNRYAPIQVQGNTQAGSFAGANGRTYYQSPQGQGALAIPQQVGGINTLLLLALAVGAVFVMKS